MDSFIDRPYDDEVAAFGQHWCGPESYEMRKKTLVAEYRKRDGSDGQNVRVFCTALPARSYGLEIEADENSAGTRHPAYRVNTGEAKIAATIAGEIMDGMLTFAPNI